MDKIKISQLVKDLQRKLSFLLEDPVFAKARQDRAAEKKGGIADALMNHNMAVSEKLLHLDPSSVSGNVEEKKIDDFRKRINVYMQKNGTGNPAYNNYLSIISEYLAFVARDPLHPPEVRHLENTPPKDSDHRTYCGLKSRHIKDSLSLCRFCNCIPWPVGPTENHVKN